MSLLLHLNQEMIQCFTQKYYKLKLNHLIASLHINEMQQIIIKVSVYQIVTGIDTAWKDVTEQQNIILI